MKSIKILKYVFLIILMIGILFITTGCDFLDELLEEDDDLEQVVNVSNKSYTLMLYMCGSDLESDGGYASDDIEEMLKASLAKEVNFLLYTGGATKWYNEDIADGKNQIFKIENGKLNLIDNSIGTAYMSNPNTLTYFLNYAKKNYPADRYGLILWDHGGGAIGGFGYDEIEANEEESLTIDELKNALDSSKLKFDFIGFDACLMGTVETAYALRNNADYLIASEETEPGTGWEYKKILNTLSKNTAQNTVDLGKTVVDTFIKSNNGLLGSDATLSMIDLKKMDNVYSKLDLFMNDMKDKKFNTNNYGDVSQNLKKSKSYADGEIDTIDLIDFASKLNISASNDLINAVKEAVVYNKTTDYVENSNGLSIYIPNEDLEYYDKMVKIYKNIGISDSYINIINEYVNLIAGGTNGYYSVNHYNYRTDENYENYDWYDEDLVNSFSDYYENNSLDTSELEVTEKGDYFALSLTEEQWNNIVDVQSSVWYDDGEGYIDLGTDSYYEVDDDGDLIIGFDGTWIAINGQTVMYNVVEQTDKYEKGKVPAYLNDKEVYLIIYWDLENKEVKVLGAEPMNAYGNSTMYARGYQKIKSGDKIKFLVDYYDYDGEYDDYYIYGDEIVVGNDGLKVTYEDAGSGECLVYYILTDIYNNVYYTEPVILY